MTTTVFLADLRHNYSGVLANDCMPLGVAYLKAVMDRDLPEVNSRLFAYPDRLLEAMKASPPDVLMLSNYVWNEELSFRFARVAKQINPDILTVMGGPNIALEDDRQIAYLEAHPEIDVYVLGEADFLAAEVVRQYLDAGRSLKRLASSTIPSSIYRNTDGAFRIQKIWDRHKEIDELPSVWLTGILDEFFDGKLAPMIETNRGCPFTCSFCVQGTGWYTKVHNFSVERVKEEIAYVAKRNHEVCPSMGTLRIADSNYGMYERDIEISAFIGEMQKQYGWPTFIDATTGKNRPERIIESLEKVSGALVLYQAVQSLDERTLKNIKRSTIKLDTYERIQVHVRGRGLRSNSDLILGLPGETLQTHLDAVRKLVDAGTSEMHNFQSMLLKGAEMETLASRQQFAFTSRFRVLPKNFGVYADEKIFDMDEIVVSTDTMPFPDYIEARIYHMVCSIFWNNDWFKNAIRFAATVGVPASEWLDAVRAGLDQGPEAIRQLLIDFARETTDELFPTREECAAFYGQDENFARLRRGEIGDNLMYKYRALASFKLWPDVCKIAMDVTRRLAADRGAAEQFQNFDAVWADFARYTELSHAHGYAADTLLAPATTTLEYDIAGWIDSGFSTDVERYRLLPPHVFEFRLPADSARELAAALHVWTTDLKALSKMVTRIRPAVQTRTACAAIDQPGAA